MDIKNRPIGIFDSGVGGLTVVKQVMKVLPNENIIYFGDTARVPYGTKSVETIYGFSCQIIKFLQEQNVKAIIIACNTISSTCYQRLKNEFDIPIIEVLEQGVNSAIKVTKNKKVGVIGTTTTIKSSRYEEKLKEYEKAIEVYSVACPLFVPLAEEGFFDSKITVDIAKIYLNELLNKDIDSLILGCTHYPLLKKSIEKALNKNIEIIDPAYETALKMKNYLINNNIQSSIKYEDKFFVSDKCDKFNFICSVLLENEYLATKIDIEKY